MHIRIARLDGLYYAARWKTPVEYHYLHKDGTWHEGLCADSDWNRLSNIKQSQIKRWPGYFRSLDSLLRVIWQSMPGAEIRLDENLFSE